MVDNDGNRQGQSINSDASQQRAHRGFAAMNGDLQRRIARKGGVASSRAQIRDAHGQFRGSGGSRSSSEH